VTGRWTGHGLCLTGRVRSVLCVYARLGLMIGRSGTSNHGRPDASDRSGCLLDSNRTLALWRPVLLTARPVADSLKCYSDLTSVSGQLRDQRVRSSFARLVNSLSASSRASRMGGVLTARPVCATSASGQRDCCRILCLTALFEGVCL
jgi:hypothetical protein